MLINIEALGFGDLDPLFKVTVAHKLPNQICVDGTLRWDAELIRFFVTLTHFSRSLLHINF